MAIINNEREETFDWVFREFQKSVKESPCLAMIDEDTALRNSLQKTFTGMSILICLWHIQQNMKKHSAFLNSNAEEKKIKFLIISLPFVKNKIKFEEDYKAIVEYLEKNKHEKTHKYMEAYYAKKERAQLIYAPVIFTAGIHTTSRAESTNSVVKKYVNSRSELCDFISFIVDYEKKLLLESPKKLRNKSVLFTQFSNK